MKRTLTLIFAGFLSVSTFPQAITLNSPDRSLTAEINTRGGISAELSDEGGTILKIVNMSLQTQTGEAPEPRIRKVLRRTISETVKPEVREKSATLTNSCNELEIRFDKDLTITFRLYNEGLAYRFSTTANDSLTVYSETMDILFDTKDSARYQSSVSFNSAYETPYEHSPVTGIGAGKLCNLPFLVEKNSGQLVMIAESDLFNYPGLWLRGTGSVKLSGTNPPLPRSFRYDGSLYGHGQVAESFPFIARVKGTRTFPWRIFAVSGDEAELVANNMVYLLASPSAITDVSWIKPGVVMFDWWGKHNIYGTDFKAGINTETARYYIDFCAAKGFRYFLFDDGWCVDQDILKPVPELDIEAVTAYGAEKGVDVMVWVLWNVLEKKWNDAFRRFGEWGIKGIKIDFMNRDDQKMVEFYEKAAERAAAEKLVVDFHGAYKPDGLRRKYPNVLTREALIEFEYNGWTDQDDPVHHNLLPYIRMFAGPMDYIPATMRNSTKNNFRPLGDYPMGQGTRAHSMALFVILSSPMTMLPDSPSDYYREQECTSFLSGIPVEWDETKLLKGRLAEYTVMARRSGREWFIGAVTNRNSRTISVETSFLEPGRYRIEAIEDGINASTRAEDYKRTVTYIEKGDILTLNLAPGGGWIARITRE